MATDKDMPDTAIPAGNDTSVLPGANTAVPDAIERAEDLASDTIVPATDEAAEAVTKGSAKLKDQAGDKLRSAATATKEKAVEAAGTVSKIVDDAAAKIDENFGPQYGDYARTAAKSIDEFAHKVGEKDVDQIADDAREFVKKRPAIAIGAAAAIGFALVRLFKSSGKDQA